MAERRHKPFIAALTGSIGMGKTETAKLFGRLGVPVHDADAAVHKLYAKGGKAVAPIAKAFPDAVVDDAVDRTGLMARLKGDDAAFRTLEGIVHPLVIEDRRAFLADAQKHGDAFVVLDIPLLFETGGEKDVDAVIVVSAPPHIQRERVLKRPGMTLEKLEAIHARQVPDSEKRAKADFVIETAHGLEQAFEDVKKIAAELLRRAKEASQR